MISYTKEIDNYWNDIDDRLEILKHNGYVKLPSLQDKIDLPNLSNKINNEMNGSTFAELGMTHQIFLKDIKLDTILAPKLFDIAKEAYGYNGDISNQYHIARRVDPGNSKEMYRAHFDSHLFTIVFPIQIPKASQFSSAGELIYIPKARNIPKNEFKNSIEKLYFKRYASKEGLQRLAKTKDLYTEDFNDYAPLLFKGNTTLHTNKQVSIDCSSYRLTLLAHFFDPSPKYGVGSLLRFLRRR